MKYVIHATVIFDAIEYTLTSLQHPHTFIKLSNSAGRVLAELMKYHDIDEPVTREHLFLVVWKNQGLEPSNGNLNQQVSLIRKIFNTFQLPESPIITIPKRGLKLNKQLIIKKMKHKTPNTTISSKNIIHNDYNADLTSPMILNVKLYMKYIIMLIIFMTMLLITGFIYFHIKQNNIKLYCCKEIDSCNICTFNIIPGSEFNEDNIQHPEII